MLDQCRINRGSIDRGSVSNQPRLNVESTASRFLIIFDSISNQFASWPCGHSLPPRSDDELDHEGNRWPDRPARSARWPVRSGQLPIRHAVVGADSGQRAWSDPYHNVGLANLLGGFPRGLQVVDPRPSQHLGGRLEDGPVQVDVLSSASPFSLRLLPSTAS